MNETKIMTFENKQVMDSRDISKMVNKHHQHLMRDIRHYIKVLKESPKLDARAFFIESTYTSRQGKELPCFLCTKQGCEMIANKLTGDKGIQFTARYVTLFNQYQEERKELTTHMTPEELAAKNRELDIKENYVKEMHSQNLNKAHELRNQDVKLFLALGKVADSYHERQMATEFRNEAIHQMNALPVGGRREYSASEIGRLLGVSPITIGKWGNKLHIKQDHNLSYRDRYGAWRYFPEALQIFQDNALEIQNDFADNLDDF
ncbi:Rha family transcriptional regulator [Lactobacillus sp. 3B(2020)]|uniref:Rha family transcriptional regulator n=1 Tax=Lactobacillus sp. 3B(2020) TaxID=2695882 RepID=UPI0015DE79E5|nr:Rha family transcriptional regulator [Lactobacillus sp. 3B(2020)]QLL70256.1 phage regulatory protein [Lactobacillus sp. 3B(2020)]